MFYRRAAGGASSIRLGPIQVGIRTDYDHADKSYAFAILDADQANEQSVQDIVRTIRARVGDSPAYLTFDIGLPGPGFCSGNRNPGSRRIEHLEGTAGSARHSGYECCRF